MENKKFKGFHWKILRYCIILFVLLFLGSLSNEFDISAGNLIDKLYELMMIISALLTFEIVFYMFRLKVLTENKRSCGLRERLFRERMEYVLGKNDIPKKDLNEEKWEQIKKEFIHGTSKKRYNEIFEKANRKELPDLQKRYSNIMNETSKTWKWLTRSLIPALSAILFSFLLIVFENLDLEIPSFVINSILAFIIISFVIFVIETVYYIPFVLEDWITKKEDS